MFLRRASSSGILEINRRRGRLGRTRERVAPSNDQIWSNRDYLDLLLVSPDSLACMPDPFLRSECRPPLTTAINILIVGTLRDSLERVRDADAFHFRRPPNRETGRVRVRMARVHARRERAGFCVLFRRIRFTGRRLTCREQVYGLFQAVCHGRRRVFKACVPATVIQFALNFRYAHAKDRSRRLRSISGSRRFSARYKIAEISFKFFLISKMFR